MCLIIAAPFPEDNTLFEDCGADLSRTMGFPESGNEKETRASGRKNLEQKARTEMSGQSHFLYRLRTNGQGSVTV